MKATNQARESVSSQHVAAWKIVQRCWERDVVAGFILVIGIPLIIYEASLWRMQGNVFWCVLLACIWLLLMNQLRRVHKIEVSDGVRGVLRRMKYYLEDPEAVLEGLTALRKILQMDSKWCHFFRDFSSAGGMKIVLHCMNLHAKYPEIIERGFDIFVCLSRKDNDPRKILGSITVEQIVDLMESKGGSRSAHVQRKACLLLGSLADGDLDVQDMMHATRALPAIVDGMNSFPDDEDLQLWGCFALFNGSYRHQDCKMSLVQHGGMLSVLRAMKRFPENLSLQKQAISVLGNVILENHHSVEATISSLVNNEGALDILRQTIGRLSSCAGQQPEQDVLEMAKIILQILSRQAPKIEELE